MDNVFIKILRILFFFPICILAIGLVNWGLGHLFLWFIGLSKFWFIVIFVFLGGVIWKLFKMFSALLAILVSYVSPVGWLGAWTISILALINGGLLGYKLWTTIPEIFSGWGIFVGIIVTLLILEVTYVLIYGAISASEERDDQRNQY